MNPQPKQRPVRCPAYLSYIRRQSCIQCGRHDQINSHHTETGGIGTKGSDLSAIPLCIVCHRKLHDQHGKRGPWSDEEIAAMVGKLREKWIAEGNEQFWAE